MRKNFETPMDYEYWQRIAVCAGLIGFPTIPKTNATHLWSAFVPAPKCCDLSLFLSRFLGSRSSKFERPKDRWRPKRTFVERSPFS